MLNRTTLLLIMLVMAGSLEAQEYCGESVFSNFRGPFDYRDPAASVDLNTVESHHFDARAEALEGFKGNSVSLAGDLDFTLRYFPNHHRALYTMVRYHTKPTENGRPRPKPPLPAECYMIRAITFAPDDAVVRLIYGIFLSEIGESEKSIRQLKEAVRLAPDSPEVHYNLGLIYFEDGELELARKHATVAYGAGYPLPGLRNMLAEKGLTIEP